MAWRWLQELVAPTTSSAAFAAPYLTPLESVTFIMLLLLLPARHKRMAWAVNKLTGIKEKKIGV